MAAGPALSGLYRLGGVGIVDVSLMDGRVVGRLKASEECREIAPESTVLTGSFEGTLFVGSVTVCQSGASCVPQKSYPFLGFWIDDGLVGSVKLDSGCSSAAIDSGAIHITSATAEDRQALLGGKAGSAVEVAARDAGSRSLERTVSDGTALVKEGKYAEALVILHAVQGADPDNVSLLYVTGVAHAGLKQSKQAVELLRRAASLAKSQKRAPRLVGEIHFNLACALAQEKRNKEAVEALSAGFDYAGESGFTLDDLLKNPDLAPLRRDKDFQSLTARMRLASKPRGKSNR
jgi:tetratricopeptide (TPR) repeat protein